MKKLIFISIENTLRDETIRNVCLFNCGNLHLANYGFNPYITIKSYIGIDYAHILTKVIASDFNIKEIDIFCYNEKQKILRLEIIKKTIWGDAMSDNIVFSEETEDDMKKIRFFSSREFRINCGVTLILPEILPLTKIDFYFTIKE